MEKVWLRLKDLYKSYLSYLGIILGIIALGLLAIALMCVSASFYLFVASLFWPVALKAAEYCAIAAVVSYLCANFILFVGSDLSWT